MTDLLEHAFETVRALPPDRQDEIAQILLAYAGRKRPPIQLTPEEEADLDASDAEVERGEFATEDELRALWAKYGA